MKYFWMLIILIIQGCVIVDYYSSPYIENLSISVSLNDPVDLYSSNEIHFTITNKHEESFYLDKHSLFYLIGVFNEKGKSYVTDINQNPKFDIKTERYILVEGNKTQDLTITTSFFKNLSLQPSSLYIFDIEYYTTLSNSIKDCETFTGRVDIAPIIFRTGK